MKHIYFLAFFLSLLVHRSEAQCLSDLFCPTNQVTYCDTTANDALFWNDSLFRDPFNGNQDLADAPVNLSIRVIDTCTTGILTPHFTLKLDLDGDGSIETVLFSRHLPGADTVYFGNLNTPNFSGGTPQNFDARPVPVDHKYAFTVEKTMQGDTVTFRLRWATAADPTTYVDPQLPYGFYIIQWEVEQLGGAGMWSWDYKYCNNQFKVRDCAAPTPTCVNGLTAHITPTHFAEVAATDLVQAVTDNYTPAAKLEYAMRLSGMGTGFPLTVDLQPVKRLVFSCQDEGPHSVEVWARDQAGNASFCETTVTVDDDGNCGGLNGIYVDACTLHFCDDAQIPDVTFELQGSSNAVPPYTLFTPGDTSGCLSHTIGNAVPIFINAQLGPSKDDHPLEGVNTLDLVLIARHFLGVEALDSPYKLLAANAYLNPPISALDVIELRKLILGIYSALPTVPSWRFVDTSYVFPHPGNPYYDPFPQSIAYCCQDTLFARFYGIKIGDVNCTALQPPAPPIATANVTLPNLNLQAGEIAEVPVGFTEAGNYYGFQFGLHYDPSLVQVLELTPAVGDADNYSVFADRVNASWSWVLPTAFLPGDPLYKLKIKALAPVHLADAFSLNGGDLRAEAYPSLASDSLTALQLAYGVVPTTEPAADGRILAPQPNPTTAGARIGLRLERPEAVTVELLDATGRLVYRREHVVEAGNQLLELPATAFPQAGVYFWRVRAGAAERTGKLMRQ